jgi:inhibitor of KinA
MSSDPRIVAAGDAALILELGNGAEADARVNARAVTIAAHVEAAGVPGVQDVVPTFQTVGVYFDPLKTDRNALSLLLRQEAMRPIESMPSSGEATVHHVPVWYGGSFGPDLGDVAAAAGLTEHAVVSLHAGTVYRIFMLGFVPGFAYMGLVRPEISLPRRPTPRISVPAGSVGIAGSQTGVYPAESPGGWHLIGRTPIRAFDPARADPFLFKAGDSVHFYPADPSASEG